MKKPSELPLYTVVRSEVGDYIRRRDDEWLSLEWLKVPDRMSLVEADAEFGDYRILAEPRGWS